MGGKGAVASGFRDKGLGFGVGKVLGSWKMYLGLGFWAVEFRGLVLQMLEGLRLWRLECRLCGALV